jgi:LemA protein
MKRSWLVGLGCLGALLVAALILVRMSMGQYNRLVELQEDVQSQWAQVENVYQRRADLIPNLVATVKGSAAFEQETLRQVVEARSRVGQVAPQAAGGGADITADPERFRRFAEAQDQLSSALSRLLVVVERYPELRSTQAFRDLMPQLEGAENRIAVERRRYNEVAREFNATRRRVPTSWFVSLLGWDFPAKEYFESQPGAEQAPRVEF